MKKLNRVKRRAIKNKYNRLRPGKTADSIIRRNFEKFLPKNYNSVPKKPKNPYSVSAQNSGDDILLIKQTFGRSCRYKKRDKESYSAYKDFIGVDQELNFDQENGQVARQGESYIKNRRQTSFEYKREEGESLDDFRSRMKVKAE